MAASNNQKMREALLAVKKLFDDRIMFQPDIRKAHKAVEAALSAPPRNCDVGTAEEQMKRQHDTMCNTTKACPDSDWSCRKCFAEWSQMPYEKGSAK